MNPHATAFLHIQLTPHFDDEAERFGFQLSLLKLAYQGDLPPAMAAELEQYASGRAVSVEP